MATTTSSAINTTTATATTPWITLAQRLTLGLALLLMCFHFSVYVHYALNLAAFPFDYDQGEGFELNDTILLSQGQSPYVSNEIYPYYASNYPPLYHILLIPFAKAFGPEYWYGRLAGFAATLITAWAIFYAVRRESGHALAGVVAGLAYLASNYTYHIGPLFRQHITMIMFEALAVLAIATIERQPNAVRRRNWLLLATLCLLAAGYTKQLSIATSGAVFAFLLLRGLRRAILWGVLFAMVAGGLFLLLNVATEGQWWLNTITANVNQYIFGQYLGLLNQFIRLHWPILLLAGLLAIYELYMARLSVYTVWLVFALGNSVLAGKWGAGDSYFVTAIAAICLMAGIFTGRTLNRAWQLPAWAAKPLKPLRPASALLGIVAGIMFVIYGATVIKLPMDSPVFAAVGRFLNVSSNTKFADFYDGAGWTEGYATIGQVPSAKDVAAGWQIVDMIKDDPRPILSEEAAFSFRSGKPVVTNPTQLLNLYNGGHLDTSALVADIEAQRFGAVIFRARFYPPPVLDAVDRAYEPAATIAMNGYEYTVLLPKVGYMPPNK
jgi:Dolichyl-phosphate-mannose-protein mannosyltransferase